MQTLLNKNQLITDKEQLLEYFHSGCKPMAQWRIGTEWREWDKRLAIWISRERLEARY